MVENVFLPVTDLQGLFSGRIKLYPNADGGEDMAQIIICDKQIFNPNKLEKHKASQLCCGALKA